MRREVSRSSSSPPSPFHSDSLLWEKSSLPVECRLKRREKDQTTIKSLSHFPDCDRLAQSDEIAQLITGNVFARLRFICERLGMGLLGRVWTLDWIVKLLDGRLDFGSRFDLKKVRSRTFCDTSERNCFKSKNFRYFLWEMWFLLWGFVNLTWKHIFFVLNKRLSFQLNISVNIFLKNL